MYRASYSEIAGDDPRLARRQEGQAFDIVIAMLHEARGAPADEALTTRALDGVERLWSFLLSDLANPDNALPAALRAQLVSIGLWMMREIGRLRARLSLDLEPMISVNATIRAGLR